MKKILTIALIIGLLFVLLVYFLGGSVGGVIQNPIIANQIVDIAKIVAVIIAFTLGALLLFPVMKVAIVLVAIVILFYGIKKMFFNSKSVTINKS